MQFHQLYDLYESYHWKGPPSTILLSVLENFADEMPFHQLRELYEPYHWKRASLSTLRRCNQVMFFTSFFQTYHIRHMN